ncbi:T9SS type B sorting domain-containing protein [Flavobacterium sp.]|uniref:T9SS type B sorting domain-containing protein n=1 Tax=Flavobacterium sp. TaxID=239 RepID=UPI00260B7837|nr:T9SS type B sorting domain-containing protein [Flavobacterium sp.]
MKKLLTLLILFSCSTVFSQVITVDTSTYTVPQLVNNVLINSPCITANNITWSTGTNFGSSNGIGYFQNTNPNFPMQSGVILSTGNILNAPGPNLTMLNDGSTSWPGDSTLESTLAASGITMNSVNATVLEFEFTPLSPHFDFDFLFASEEYGNFQCQFSDAFAFLLTNMSTGVTTNLAVVPGTSTPISVVTIRDFLYNSGCESVNPSFFGTFNGGSNASSSPINFNGQTVVLNASSTLVPGTLYKIKLVIADRTDILSDSAIFLSSNSFNLGQEVLGADLTIANNTAVCFGTSEVIESNLNPSNFTFVWKKDGVTLAGETGPNLTVTQPGTYTLEYTNITFTCETITDSIVVEFTPEYITPEPIDLFLCDTGLASYNYNLAQNTALVTAGLNPGVTISFHASLLHANNNTNALPSIYSSAGNQTIYVRINKENSSCFTVKSFELLLSPPPTATQPLDINLCESTFGSGEATFNLNPISLSVLNGQSGDIYSVSYYNSLADASSGSNASPNNIFITSGTTIHIRVQLITDSSCFSLTSVNLNVSSLPVVDELEDVIVCDNYVLQPITNGNYFTAANGGGTALFAGDVITETQTVYIYNAGTLPPFCKNESSFRVIIVKPEDLPIESGDYCESYSLPGVEFGGYFTAPNGGGTELSEGSAITTTQTVYFYFISETDPSCLIDLPFSITIIERQDVPILQNGFDCTSFILQPLSYGNYYDAPNGGGNQLAVGTAITSSQTVYIFGQNSVCTSESSFEVVIGINFPTDVTDCVGYTLPNLNVGNYFTEPMGMGTQIPAGTIINTNQTIYVYAVSQSPPNCTDNYNFTVSIVLPTLTAPTITSGCENYVLPSIPVGNYFTGSNGTGTALFAGDVLTTSQTIYIFVSDNAGCQNEITFDVTVYQRPILDNRSDIDACHSYTLTNLANGNYFTQPNGGGTQMNGGDVLTTSQLIYIYAIENGCPAQTSFQLNIFSIDAFETADVTACDSYVLPALTGNNKYYTQPNGPFGTGIELAAGSVINSTQTIYIFIQSGERINCTDESDFVVNIVPTPVIASIPNVNVCESYTLPTLTVGNYFTETGGNGTMLNAGDILTTNQTLFVYAETGTTPNCFDEKSFNVSIFNVEQLPNVTSCSSYTLPTLAVGNFYNGPNGTGGMLAQGSSVATSKTIYVFAYSGYSPNCSDETSFTVTIIPEPVAYPVPIIERTICDEDDNNNGVTDFDLTTLSATILASQTGAEFNISFYENLEDATNENNAITISDITTIYVRVNNSLAPDCFDIKPIAIIVNKLPEPNATGGIVCIDSETGTLLNPYTITTGLSTSTHTFQWFDELGNVIGTSNNYQAILPGQYSVIATNNATGCPSEEVFVTVNQSEPAVIAYSISEDFTPNQTVVVSATGTGGNYEYQLDDGAYQSSPTFNNVQPGIHTITVRDINGCGKTTTEAIVVYYPHYFTPNGDGVNEYWNIYDLRDQEVAIIEIYDRFGKLMKQIKPSGQGWDGTYNGREVPSDDYWFVINYQKDNKNKEFKAHFSLKR